VNKSLVLIALGACLGLGACGQPVEWRGEGKHFLTLTGFVQIAPEQSSLEGFFRWGFYSDDPVSASNPEPFCEAWEYLELVETVGESECPSCSHVYQGSAELQLESPTTCDDLGWTARDVELGWTSLAGLDATEEEIDRYVEEGYIHGVLTPWSPETGGGQSWQSLFIARPELWSPEDGEVGSSSESDLSGQYVLSSRFLWDLGVGG
jgi:hypothetical protein